MLFILGAAGVLTAQDQAGQGEDAAATGRSLFEREVSLDQPLVEINTSSFELSLPGSLTEPANWIESGWTIGVDITTAEPVMCAIHDSELDLSTSLSLVGDNIFEEATSSRDGDLERRLVSTDAGAIGRFPFLSAEWFLRQKSDGAGVVLLKQRAALIEGHTVLCVHNEVGYRKTFESFFEKLIEDIEFRKRKDQNNIFEQIQIVRINGSAVGFLRIAVKAEGDKLLTTESSSSFVPAKELDHAVTRDTRQLTLATPDGLFLRGALIVAGDRQMQLSLGQTEEGGWVLTESRGGQERSVNLDLTQRPASFISSRRRIGMEMKRTTREPFSYVEWQPLTDPTVLSSVKVTWPAPADPSREAMVDDGGVVGRVWFDTDGSTKLATATNNGVTIELNRVHVAGSLD